MYAEGFGPLLTVQRAKKMSEAETKTKIEKKSLREGDEIVVPAVSWITTYSPLQQFGLKLKFVDIDINSNPNYIFENDVQYDTVQLFDYDTNTVFVNSFIECQHYVKGGWSFIPEERNEDYYHDVLFNISTLLIFISIFTFKKLFNK